MKKNHFFIQALCLSMCLTSCTESDGEKVTFLFFLVVCFDCFDVLFFPLIPYLFKGFIVL